MLASSILMVGYVLTRDIRHKKSVPIKIGDADTEFFEEIKSEELILTEYDYRKKTA